MKTAILKFTLKDSFDKQQFNRACFADEAYALLYQIERFFDNNENMNQEAFYKLREEYSHVNLEEDYT